MSVQVHMKKATISQQQLVGTLCDIALEVQRAASFDPQDPAFREIFDVDMACKEFFSAGEAVPVSNRGRGLRVRLPVGWIWPPARMPAEEGTATIHSLVRRIPGVEEVTAPELDPQLGLVWSMYVTIRLAQ